MISGCIGFGVGVMDRISLPIGYVTYTCMIPLSSPHSTHCLHMYVRCRLTHPKTGWGAVVVVQGAPSPGVMEGLGRGLVRRKEDLVRGTEAGLEAAREVARRGLEAADNAAHVMGINRIPVLRTCLWGQVHTGFWNSYEV